MSGETRRYLAVASLAVVLGVLVVSFLPEMLFKTQQLAVREERYAGVPEAVPPKPLARDVEETSKEMGPTEEAKRPPLDLFPLVLVILLPLAVAIVVYLESQRRIRA
ncbi:MAG: hypothetical protein GTN80_07785 [Nitrososphaeria archaeon]|nr:hypothetical protein [Nitrososphaeria archaeon]NIN52964.1 hypothetical protein [Nitrososphaeria archaeon]NIQ33523.1 hypothetical protein [Nitrososphaeria archaeon]